ncbi:hypothetical protein COCNU_06G007400 [Cocos nucifera]|uniref:Uncharacterized protein n=1 Tax=Cocos nucifera TaxID=13894 RepID=A0A8K0N2T3_COCNU|nr:hypothetical protein COCNU_06G007400 [Cocos nucifera]
MAALALSVATTRSQKPLHGGVDPGSEVNFGGLIDLVAGILLAFFDDDGMHRANTGSKGGEAGKKETLDFTWEELIDNGADQHR